MQVYRLVLQIKYDNTVLTLDFQIYIAQHLGNEEAVWESCPSRQHPEIKKKRCIIDVNLSYVFTTSVLGNTLRFPDLFYTSESFLPKLTHQ